MSNKNEVFEYLIDQLRQQVNTSGNITALKAKSIGVVLNAG